MRKLIIISTNPNSLIIFKGDLIKELVNYKFKVFILCSDYTDKLKNQIRIIGGIPIDINLNRLGLNIFNEFINFLDLIKIIKSIAPDYIITYFAKSIIYGLLTSKIAGVKYRYAIIEGLGYSFTKDPNHKSLKKLILKSLFIVLYKISLKQATKIFFLNKDDYNELINLKIISKKQLGFIIGPIGINLDEFPYHEIENNGKFNFLFIGRLIKEKGIIEFLRAAEIIHTKYTDISFTVLGSLEKKNNPGFINYKSIKNLLSKEYIIWKSNVEVFDWIKSSSAFVLPSYREGFPRSTQEVMAVGRSIITTNVPGCRETVINGFNGFLIDPGDVESLVNVMEYLILNPKENKKMGIESSRIAHKLYSNKIFNKKIIDHILD